MTDALHKICLYVLDREKLDPADWTFLSQRIAAGGDLMLCFQNGKEFQAYHVSQAEIRKLEREYDGS